MMVRHQEKLIEAAFAKGVLKGLLGISKCVNEARAAQIAKQAQTRNSTLRESALASGAVTEAQFDAWVIPAQMLGHSAQIE
jgi:fumarate hydratase class II